MTWDTCRADTTSGGRCGRTGPLFGGLVPLCPQHARMAREWVTDEVDALREAARTFRPSPTGVVYYLRDGRGLVKIGTSTRLEDRVATLSREWGPLEMLATEPGGYELERERHALFDQDRAHGEWFVPSDPIMEHITTIQGNR